MRNKKDSEFIQHHLPCPDCGSSDGLSLNSDGSTKCFSCEKFTPASEVKQTTRRNNQMSEKEVKFIPGKFKDLVARKIPKEICQKYGYSVGKASGKPVQIANYYDPDTNERYAQKIRGKNKKFWTQGKPETLFGQHLYKGGKGKKLYITEGEIDALSLHKALSSKDAVVSVPTGAASAKSAVAHNLEWIEGFELVTFVFDSDKPGKEAARECAGILSPRKARIANLPLKDASDMVMQDRQSELVACCVEGKEFRPDGIAGAEEIRAALLKGDEGVCYAFPWEGLNKMTLGMRKKEVILFTAGTGIGKSTIVREINHYLHANYPDEKIGYFGLEESLKKTAVAMMSIELSKPLHLQKEQPDYENDEELMEIFDKTAGSGRFFAYDHWGSLDPESLYTKIRYMVRGLGCEWIFLDHISIVVSAVADKGERTLLDNIMTNLGLLAEELDCGIVAVSHLRKSEGKSHEEGAKVSMNQLRGSNGLGQLAHTVIGAERNQQGESIKNKMVLRVLKCRHTGETGAATTLEYIPETGRLVELDVDQAEAYQNDFQKERYDDSDYAEDDDRVEEEF